MSVGSRGRRSLRTDGRRDVMGFFGRVMAAGVVVHVPFATLTLTLDSQSTMSWLLDSELVSSMTADPLLPGRSDSANRIHHGSTGAMVTPGGGGC